MPLSNSEKQKKFREKHLGSDGNKARLQFIVGRRTQEQVNKLQKLLEKNKNALIEQVIEEALLWHGKPENPELKSVVKAKKESAGRATVRNHDGWLQRN